MCVIATCKSTWIFLLCVALLSGCQQKQKQPKEQSYLIVGDIEGCNECQTKLWLEDSLINMTQTANGRFTLRGAVTQPGLYAIYYSSKVNNTVSGFVQLHLPADSVHIRATKKLIRTDFYQQPFMGGSYLKNTVVFTTAAQQQQWEQYLLTRDSLWHKFFVDKALVTAKFRETFSSGNKALIEQWADSVKGFDYRASSYWAAAADLFVRQHPTSVVALYAMLDNRNDRPSVERFRQYYQAMPAQVQQSYTGQLLDKQLAKNEGRNQNSQRFVGRRIQHLAGKTPTGQVLDAARLFQQNKLTLIEFWASWCGPCRMEMPQYRQLYSQYHGKGFGMIGVSLDNNYNKWVQAIAEDSLRIPHLSELQGGNGEDIRRFGITGIPANLLVDSTGHIVAVDVLLPKLRKKLQHTL